MQRKQVDAFIQQRLVHEIHTSERKSFRGCRRRWQWIFRDMYYPHVTAKPLEFGVAFHEAMEVFYNPDTWNWPTEVKLARSQRAFVQTCEKQRAKYLEIKDEQYISDQEIEDDYDERIELGKGMLRYFFTEIAPRHDSGWKPLKVEVEFMVPIQNPDTDEYLICHCDQCLKRWAKAHDGDISSFFGLPVTLAGRIDMLAEDNHGDYWIVDWKTAARLAKGELQGDKDEFLELDDQISSYVMAMRRKLGLNVRGFVYVEIRKAVPAPPPRNKTQRLGRWYSVNKNLACDYELYKQTVAENDAEAYEAGLYDDHLKFLEAEGFKFSNRYQLVKTDQELYEIEKMLFEEASDIVDPNLRIYPNPGRFNCGFCAFRQPCIEKFRGGDYQYMLDTLYDKREKHYYEEKIMSTDSKGGA